MSFRTLYQFLNDLQANNSKEWMDLNRSYYHDVRDWYINWLNGLDIELGKIDPDYTYTPGRKAINRINNNLMFHPEKPTYKNHFGAGLDHEGKQGDFYIHLGTTESFIAGGYWKPPTNTLTSIREALDYNGEEFVAIIEKPSFKAMFGSIINQDPLKTAPKEFSKDHKYINLLRHRTFAVSHDVSQQEVVGGGFKEKVISVYKEMLPFRRYLNQATTV